MIDRDELAPDARALFDSARAALSPDDVAVRRVRARVTAAVAAGAIVASAEAAHGAASAAHGATSAISATATHGAASAIAATSATSAATTVAAAIAGKLAAVVLVAGVVAGAGALVVRRGGVAPTAPSIASTAARMIEADEPPCDVRSAAPTSPATAAPTALAAPSRAPVEPPPVRRRVAAVAPIPARAPAAPIPARVPAPAPAAPPASLARETELVDVALAAMAHGRPDAALAALAHYTSETAGRGQLAEDAAAIEIEAHCRLGDARAAGELAAFAARWPRSTEHARLAAVCQRDRGSETP